MRIIAFVLIKKKKSKGNCKHFKLENSKKNKQNGSKRMCKKLKEISIYTRDSLYEKLEEEFAQAPINIHRILDKLGIQYCALDFSSLSGVINNIVLPNQANMVMGAVAAYSESVHGKDSVEISVNVNDGYHRQRFTLAHELAHCMLHADDLKDGRLELRTSLSDQEPREKEANILAGELLIPENLLKIEYVNMAIPYLPALAEKFDVSENVMAARLQHLKMGYYKI